MMRDRKFIGSKAEWFAIYALAALICAVISVVIADYQLAALFLFVLIGAGLLGWRAWSRGEY